MAVILPEARVAEHLRPQLAINRTWHLQLLEEFARERDVAKATGDVYHALRCLALTPAERLRRELSRGRLRAHAR